MRFKLETETVTICFKNFKTKKQQEFKTNSFEVLKTKKCTIKKNKKRVQRIMHFQTNKQTVT